MVAGLRMGAASRPRRHSLARSGCNRHHGNTMAGRKCRGYWIIWCGGALLAERCATGKLPKWSAMSTMAAGVLLMSSCAAVILRSHSVSELAVGRILFHGPSLESGRGPDSGALPFAALGGGVQARNGFLFALLDSLSCIHIGRGALDQPLRSKSRKFLSSPRTRGNSHTFGVWILQMVELPSHRLARRYSGCKLERRNWRSLSEAGHARSALLIHREHIRSRAIRWAQEDGPNTFSTPLSASHGKAGGCKASSRWIKSYESLPDTLVPAQGNAVARAWPAGG